MLPPLLAGKYSSSSPSIVIFLQGVIELQARVSSAWSFPLPLVPTMAVVFHPV